MPTQPRPDDSSAPSDSEPTARGPSADSRTASESANTTSGYPDPLAAKVPSAALVWYLRVSALLAPVVGVFVVWAWTDALGALAIGFVASLGCIAAPLWLAAHALEGIRSWSWSGRKPPPVLLVWHLRLLALSAPVLFVVAVDAYWGEDTGEDLGVAFLVWAVVGCVSVPLWLAATHLRRHGAISERANRTAFGLVLLALAVFFAAQAVVSHYEPDPDPESRMVLWYGLFGAACLLWSAFQFWAARRTDAPRE